jgi:hypothetical protein
MLHELCWGCLKVDCKFEIYLYLLGGRSLIFLALQYPRHYSIPVILVQIKRITHQTQLLLGILRIDIYNRRFLSLWIPPHPY